VEHPVKDKTPELIEKRAGYGLMDPLYCIYAARVCALLWSRPNDYFNAAHIKEDFFVAGTQYIWLECHIHHGVIRHGSWHARPHVIRCVFL
jgi:hypothetical protein